MKCFETIKIENKMASLLPANALVERYCKYYQLDNARRQTLLLLLEEVLANIINHGFDDSQRHSIIFSIYHKPCQTVFRFQDDGKPFDPTQRSLPLLGLPAQDAPIGGLGIPLVRQLTDSIRYQRSGKYNILTLCCSNDRPLK